MEGPTLDIGRENGGSMLLDRPAWGMIIMIEVRERENFKNIINGKTVQISHGKVISGVYLL